MLKRTILAIILILPLEAAAGVFVFNTINPTERVTHPHGYTGQGGEIVVSVCISPGSQKTSELEIPLENAIRTWNARRATTGNIRTNQVPGNRFDVETVIVHELGHCIGLDHPHLDNLSGAPASKRLFTHANRGANFSFDLDAGSDGIQGSHLDERGDDWNLHWYLAGVNNPFVVAEVVDKTTFAIWPNQLPDGHKFVANANRHVAQALGLTNTQSVMMQKVTTGQQVRTLVADEINTLKFAQSGLDRVQGTEDDYELYLSYEGVQTGCDIQVEMKGSSFGFCEVQAASIDGYNVRLTSSRMQLGSAAVFNWFFNTVSNEENTSEEASGPAPEPEPEPEPEPDPADIIFHDGFAG